MLEILRNHLATWSAGYMAGASDNPDSESPYKQVLSPPVDRLTAEANRYVLSQTDLAGMPYHEVQAAIEKAVHTTDVDNRDKEEHEYGESSGL